MNEESGVRGLGLLDSIFSILGLSKWTTRTAVLKRRRFLARNTVEFADGGHINVASNFERIKAVRAAYCELRGCNDCFQRDLHINSSLLT